MEAADGPPGWLQEAAASVGLEALKHETSQSEYSPFRSTDRMEYSPFNMGRPPRPVLTPSLDADGDGGGIFGGILAPDSDSAESEPLGVFVTADEVIELQRWAEERRVLLTKVCARESELRVALEAAERAADCGVVAEHQHERRGGRTSAPARAADGAPERRAGEAAVAGASGRGCRRGRPSHRVGGGRHQHHL